MDGILHTDAKTVVVSFLFFKRKSYNLKLTEAFSKDSHFLKTRQLWTESSKWLIHQNFKYHIESKRKTNQFQIHLVSHETAKMSLKGLKKQLFSQIIREQVFCCFCLFFVLLKKRLILQS